MHRKPHTGSGDLKTDALTDDSTECISLEGPAVEKARVQGMASLQKVLNPKCHGSTCLWARLH